MAIPAEILSVERPKNTKVKKSGERYLVIKNPLFYPLYTENATDFGDVLQHRVRLPFPVSITPHLFVF